jgi:hypothetical protein
VAFLAIDLYPRAVDFLLSRGWIEGALEAAYRQDTAWQAVLGTPHSVLNPNETLASHWQSIAPRSDDEVLEVWQTAIGAPLSSTEAAEAAYAGYFVTRAEQSRDYEDRLTLEAFVFAVAAHRDTRARIMAG